jgi:hypothetical protein
MVSGPQLVELAEAYTEALNKGGIPVIETAWEYMQSNELENAYKNTKLYHENELNLKIRNSLPKLEEEILRDLKELKAASLMNF